MPVLGTHGNPDVIRASYFFRLYLVLPFPSVVPPPLLPNALLKVLLLKFLGY